MILHQPRTFLHLSSRRIWLTNERSISTVPCAVSPGSCPGTVVFKLVKKGEVDAPEGDCEMGRATPAVWPRRRRPSGRCTTCNRVCEMVPFKEIWNGPSRAYLGRYSTPGSQMMVAQFLSSSCAQPHAPALGTVKDGPKYFKRGIRGI